MLVISEGHDMFFTTCIPVKGMVKASGREYRNIG
jgi:hypothetical protein